MQRTVLTFLHLCALGATAPQPAGPLPINSLATSSSTSNTSATSSSRGTSPTTNSSMIFSSSMTTSSSMSYTSYASTFTTIGSWPFASSQYNFTETNSGVVEANATTTSTSIFDSPATDYSTFNSSVTAFSTLNSPIIGSSLATSSSSTSSSSYLSTFSYTSGTETLTKTFHTPPTTYWRTTVETDSFTSYVATTTIPITTTSTSTSTPPPPIQPSPSSASSPPPPADPPSVQSGLNVCSVEQKLTGDYFDVKGQAFDSLDNIGRQLKRGLERNCGVLTRWNYEMSGADLEGWDWHASGRLGIGQKHCINYILGLIGGEGDC